MTSVLLRNLTVLSAILGIAYSVGIYEQCAGDGFGTFPCDAGLTCFLRNNYYSSCQTSCPRNLGWECEIGLPVEPVATIAAGWDQCGGDGWAGATVCTTGYTCYARSVFYSQCRPMYDCPAGWICDGISATSVSPVGPVTLAPYSQCNGVEGAVCATGTGCFRNNANYSECRSNCPATWACETDVAALSEQCGGEGYFGVTRCAEGLRCYARSKWYSQCAASCPGADWIC